MRRFVFLALTSLMVSLVNAQDFVQLFMDAYPNDPNIKCITISPKMMQEILKNETGQDTNVREIISGLKSMQMIVSSVDGENYYNSALETARRSGNRYEPFASFNSATEDYQILVRKRRDEIVEMIMLSFKDNRFTVINFTGEIKTEHISTLAGSIAKERL